MLKFLFRLFKIFCFICGISERNCEKIGESLDVIEGGGVVDWGKG